MNNPFPPKIPMINPEDPTSINKWESSEHNYDNAKVVVVQLRFFHGALGDSIPKEPQSVDLKVSEARKNRSVGHTASHNR